MPIDTNLIKYKMNGQHWSFNMSFKKNKPVDISVSYCIFIINIHKLFIIIIVFTNKLLTQLTLTVVYLIYEYNPSTLHFLERELL